MPQTLLVAALACLFILPAFADESQNTATTGLEVIVDGVSNSRGNVRLAVFSASDAALFPDLTPPLKQSIAATGRTVTFHFAHLAAGHYAALAFQDENSNQVLDRNLFGIPREPWGVTGQRPFGRAPRYAESVFMLDSKHNKIAIHLE